MPEATIEEVVEDVVEAPEEITEEVVEEPQEPQVDGRKQWMDDLNDPRILAAAAAAQGKQVVDPAMVAPKAEITAPVMPEFDDEATGAEVAAKMARYIEARDKYSDAKSEDRVNSLRSEIEGKEQDKERVKVQKFVGKVGEDTFRKALPVMDHLYKQSGDLADSFTKACKALDLVNPLEKTVTKPSETKTSKAAPKTSSVKSTEQGGASSVGDLRPKHKNREEVVRANLESILAEAGEDSIDKEDRI